MLLYLYAINAYIFAMETVFLFSFTQLMGCILVCAIA